MARTDTLTNYLTDVATAIKTKKGDNTPIQASNFDTEIANLPGGGEEPVHTLAKLNEKANEFIDYLMSVPDTYPTYTNEPVTLYTPNADFKTYVIVKVRNYAQYRIYWLRNNVGIKCNNPGPIRYFFPSISQTTNLDLSIYHDGIFINTLFIQSYRSGFYSSIEDCINAIKSSSTTYSSITSESSYIEKDTPFDMPFCNTFIWETGSDSLWTSRKISSNETIEVIQ